MTFPPLALDPSKPFAARLRIWAGSRGPALRKAVNFKEDLYAPGSSGWHAAGAARAPEKVGYGLWWQAKGDSLAPAAVNPLGNDLRVAIAEVETKHDCVLVPWDAGRTLERHVELMLRGTTRTATSRHLVGCAKDLILYIPGYGPAEKLPSWWKKDVGGAIKACGLVWGGGWTTFKDYPHAELKPANLPLPAKAALAELKKDYARYFKPFKIEMAAAA